MHKMMFQETQPSPVPPPEMVADLYDLVADGLEFGPGWLQGHGHSSKGAGCLLVSAMRVYGSDEKFGNYNFHFYLLPLFLQLPEFPVCDCTHCRIVVWNDTVGRTMGEVVDLLRTTGKTLREIP